MKWSIGVKRGIAVKIINVGLKCLHRVHGLGSFGRPGPTLRHAVPPNPRASKATAVRFFQRLERALGDEQNKPDFDPQLG